jgi:acetyl-CoA/propionyl-CoA carboxylase biotin carboxyl carrier protein
VPDVESREKIIDDSIGYPVAIKAVGGGGGKGFRVGARREQAQDAFEGASREGEKFFGDPTVYIERYLPDPRTSSCRCSPTLTATSSTWASATARCSAVTRS